MKARGSAAAWGLAVSAALLGSALLSLWPRGATVAAPLALPEATVSLVSHFGGHVAQVMPWPAQEVTLILRGAELEVYDITASNRLGSVWLPDIGRRMAVADATTVLVVTQIGVQRVRFAAPATLTLDGLLMQPPWPVIDEAFYGDIDVRGDFAYNGQKTSLWVFNWRTGETTADLGAWFTELERVGDLLVAYNRGDTYEDPVVVFDLAASPSNPPQVDAFDIPYLPGGLDFDLERGRMFVTGFGEGGWGIFAYTWNAAEPEVSGNFITFVPLEGAGDLEVAPDNRHALVTGDAGLHLVDIEDLETVEIRDIEAGYSGEIASWGYLAYLAAGEGGAHVFQYWQDIAYQRTVGAGGSFVSAVDLYGRWFAARPNAIVELDLSNPALPRTVASVPLETLWRPTLARADNDLLAFDEDEVVFVRTNPLGVGAPIPQSWGIVDVAYYRHDRITPMRNFLYIAHQEYGVCPIDVTHQEQPGATQCRSVADGRYPIDFTRVGKYLLVSTRGFDDEARIYAYDPTANPDQPLRLAPVYTSTLKLAEMGSVGGSSPIFYVSATEASGNGKTLIMSFSPSGFTKVGEVDTWGVWHHITLTPSLVALTGNEGVQFMRRHSNTQLSEWARYDAPGQPLQTVWLGGGYFSHAGWQNGLVSLQMALPAAPTPTPGPSPSPTPVTPSPTPWAATHTPIPPEPTVPTSTPPVGVVPTSTPAATSQAPDPQSVTTIYLPSVGQGAPP